MFKMSKELKQVLPGLVIPIIIQSLISSLVNTADVVMLGFVSQSAISASSLANQITFVVNLFFSGLAAGIVGLVSQYWGKKDQKSIRLIFGISLQLSVAIGVGSMILCTAWPGMMMRIFTNDPELISIGSDYLRILGITYFFMAASLAYMAVMRSIGRVKVATTISSSCLVINILLNAVFIFGLLGAPKLGVVGVALATLIARVLEFILCIIDSIKSKELKCSFLDIITRDSGSRLGLLWKDFFRYAIPALGSYLVWGVGFTMYSVIFGHLGNDATAANSVANVVKNLAVILGSSVGNGGVLYIGKLMGENRLDEAKAASSSICKLAIALGLACGAVILILRPLILQMCDLTETAEGYLSFMLIVMSWYTMGKVINGLVIGGIFTAGGDAKVGVLFDVIDMWCFAVPLGFILAFVVKAPVEVVYFGIMLDEMVKLPFVYWRYKKYKWLNNITRDFE